MKFIKGALYYIKFMDHSVGTSETITCEICAWVLSQCDKTVTLTYWKTNSRDRQVVKDNVEYIKLIKSTVLKKRKIFI